MFKLLPLGLSLFVFFSATAVQANAFMCIDIFSKPEALQAPSITSLPTWLRDYQLTQMLASKRYPEAMRRAEALNLRDFAYQIEKFIVETLKTDTVVGLPRYIKEGSTEVYIVTFASGLKAVFKPDPQYWVVSSKKENSYLSNSHAEAAAYTFARILGMNLVPATVLRSIDGKTGSLQVFVDGQIFVEGVLGLNMPNGRSLTQQAVDLMAFDYLIRNSDRNEKNMLVADNQLWAIDNGSSFYPNAVRFNKARLEDVPLDQVSPAFIANLFATTPSIIRNVLKDYPDKKAIEELIERRQILLDALGPNPMSHN